MDPLSAYKTECGPAFRRMCEEWFNGLVAQSGVDEKENAETVRRYNAARSKQEQAERLFSALKGRRTLFIVLAVIGGVLALAGIFLLVSQDYLVGGILLGVGCACPAVFVPLLILRLSPAIKDAQTKLDARKAETDKLYACACEQMRPLNALLADSPLYRFAERAMSGLTLEDSFSVQRESQWMEQFGFAPGAPGGSVEGLLSGALFGDIFLAERSIFHQMGTKAYYGSIVIYWTEHSTDSEGKPIVISHSQTLTASIVRPFPLYSHSTRLVYGNDAASNLHFSRSPSHAESMSERQLMKTVKRGAKKIRKMQNASFETGGGFTGLGNEEFDVLFGALDRDNEVEFRLLFTPLAQKNMLALFRDPEGFGDDFSMQKRGPLNFFFPAHAEGLDLEGGITCRSHSVALSREECLKQGTAFFRGLYFMLAPILCIPLYVQSPPAPYEPSGSSGRNFPHAEAERLVNAMRASFEPPYADTETMLSVEFLSREGGTDCILVHASAYTAHPRVEFVTRWGGDGLAHQVPVEWVEYLPTARDETVRLKKLGLSQAEFEASKAIQQALEAHTTAFLYRGGTLCAIVSEDDRGFDRDFETIIKGGS